MYSDKCLEFSIASRDPAALVTRALPMGQGDLTGDTSGMGPYSGLFVYSSAGEAVAAPAQNAAGFIITMEHCDTKTGTFTAVIQFPEIRTAIAVGDVLIKHPVPFNIKNWVRFRLSAAKLINILITSDVDKAYPGLTKE